MSDKNANCVFTSFTNSNGYIDTIGDLTTDFFGAKLRHIRKERKLSQSDVATALGVSQGAISYWEKGEKLPDLNTFWLLCQFLDVEPGYLLGSYKNITASTGLTDDSLRVLTKWQNSPPPTWLVADAEKEQDYFEINVNEKPPGLRADVLNNLCFKYPDIFGKILDKLSTFMLNEKDIDICNNKNKHIPKNERVFFFNYSHRAYDDDSNLPHVTMDIDTLKQLTQLEIMELLHDLREKAQKEYNKK